MSTSPSERELLDEFILSLAAAVEGLAGEQPMVSWDALPSPPSGPALRWRQPVTSLTGAIWVIAAEQEWTIAGDSILKAAGVDESDAAEARSTYLEINSQALGGFARSLGKRLGREATPKGGAESQETPASARWAEVHVDLKNASFAIVVGLEEGFLEALAQAPVFPPPSAAAPPPPPPPPPEQAMAAAAGAAAEPVSSSKTFDLLLDVELPVSVSFGRAQIPLKDVLKLTTGSIVELNRSVMEPVEIIVNNCVIARGEVVVVDGNFGVRIQEVISRQERLRTLQ